MAVATPLLPLDDDAKRFFALLAGIIGSAAATTLAQERQRAEALAALDRSKTALFSNVSHEFRTPLTLMLGPTEEALAQPHGALRGEALEMVHRNQVRLRKLVNFLLDFSPLEAGQTLVKLQPTRLETFTASLAGAFGLLVEKAGLTLRADCPPLPKPIGVDEALWEKIVLNLLSNAFKYTAAGQISVSLHLVGQEVQLTISDTGDAIAADPLPKVFDRFHRVKGARGRTHEGTGIGLALVRGFTALHYGSVAVISTVGKGSSFMVKLPCAPQRPPHPAME